MFASLIMAMCKKECGAIRPALSKLGELATRGCISVIALIILVIRTRILFSEGCDTNPYKDMIFPIGVISRAIFSKSQVSNRFKYDADSLIWQNIIFFVSISILFSTGLYKQQGLQTDNLLEHQPGQPPALMTQGS